MSRRGSCCSLVVMNLAVMNLRLQVRSLASHSELRIWYCHDLWCRSQTQLGSRVAVTVVWASSCSSNQNLSLGTSICQGFDPKKTKTKNTTHTRKCDKLTIDIENVASCWFFFIFLGPYLWHMEVPRLRVESELQLLAYTTVTATWIRVMSATLTTAHGNAGSFNPLGESRD